MTAFENPKARWSQRFATDEYIFGLQSNAYLQAQQAHLAKGRTLAVADGEGRNGVWLAEQGHDVHTFDFVESAVQKSLKLASQRKVTVHAVCCDWTAFDWTPNTYDNVVGIFFQFLGPDERSEMFEKMHQALKPSGTLLIQGYSAEQLRYNTGGPGKLDHLYDEALMLESFKGYEVLDLRTYVQEIHEGSAHSGMSGLLGFVGRKPGQPSTKP
jgi:cyclopropane fatty-acyl-phospholipid synthase-like methyltransferase